ncbi:MAG: glycoside hydrolase family 97 N-terminal domain-containing protein, partial [Rikenellaceae bacterium]
MKKHLLFIFGLLLLLTSCSTEGLYVKSPDGSNSIQFHIDDSGAITYSVKSDSREIISPSATGYELKDGRSLTNYFELLSTSRESSNESWQRVWGQREFVVDNYNEL